MRSSDFVIALYPQQDGYLQIYKAQSCLVEHVFYDDAIHIDT